MTDETKSDESDAAKRIAAMSSEQRQNLKSIVDAAIADDSDEKTITHGSAQASKQAVLRRYGYMPDY